MAVNNPPPPPGHIRIQLVDLGAVRRVQQQRDTVAIYMAAFFACLGIAVSTAVQLFAGVKHPLVPGIILTLALGGCLVFAFLWHRESGQAETAEDLMQAAAYRDDLPFGVTGPGTAPGTRPNYERHPAEPGTGTTAPA